MTGKTFRRFGAAVVALAAIGAATGAQARDQIRIVGSSTVYPFASYVVEELGATTDYPTPVIESTGSGGGMKLFCQGVGETHPDITNASRRMKPSEFEMCRDNGVEDIVEIKIGYDGIVLAYQKGQPQWALTREQITLAVADKVPMDGELVANPYETWSDIDASLPDKEILVMGPPTSSGTRDAFEELVMEHGSENIDGYGGAYTKIRQDGAYVPSGENDNLIVQKLAQNADAIGIFGYSFLEENRDKVAAATIDGVAPERAAIGSGEYPVSRSLFFYVKKAHIGEVPGLVEYVDLFVSPQMISDEGYLKGLGLISLPAADQARIRQRWENRANLTLSDLQ
ncbi:phosphate binding protein [Salinisphaera sp. PC39]|uniref:PstS family phosphate ABC transporter substrate-binding protein n=1 Tax=Salinisphaera sp. PC39 TaxID=1304156 RepID=UPI00333E80CD